MGSAIEVMSDAGDVGDEGDMGDAGDAGVPGVVLSNRSVLILG